MRKGASTSEGLTLLLIDLRQQGRELTPPDARSDLRHILEQRAVVHHIPWTGDIPKKIAETAAQVLFFEYDYPDIARLSFLQQTKLHYPSIPIILVTEQHSEAFAVWAFRSRVWDYFVKPLVVDDILHCMESLELVIAERHQGVPRKAILPPHSIPTDARFRPLSQKKNAINAGISYIEKNLHENISQSEVAELCGMTPFQFSRCFKQAYGMTFQEFVIRRRMTEAVRLLKNPSASVTDVCYTVGFRDLSYFTRTFRRYVGMTPSRYKADLENLHTSFSSSSQVS
ncbi:helix-turn-helix domain-containing protein AraC type [Nitrosococcus halophilus Nc 4]|uniref:Helix-turn-helix domain-containing protein AraC type n=1 Tax=Nitrosococcus halophilus (strain Nc4) TaxID=472759 RepID=D5C109_NITHN|nr:response regulator transcription factor [Nitrosococcus halophilus]ADE14566.1 helix-turn-helix domain-containing protein AraC type [Nitrosococcus halophilus Nc 4]